MQRLDVSCAVLRIYKSLGVKGLIKNYALKTRRSFELQSHTFLVSVQCQGLPID